MIDLEFKRDCQHRLVYLFEADDPFPRTLHHFVRPFGEVRYFAGFPRPLIKMDVPGRFYASGLEEGTEFKASFREVADPDLPSLVYKALNLSFACDACGVCESRCPEQAISLAPSFSIDPAACTACLECLRVCPMPTPSLEDPA